MVGSSLCREGHKSEIERSFEFAKVFVNVASNVARSQMAKIAIFEQIVDIIALCK